MADTAKKSRIVSDEAPADEDLEESLLEEFNLRLKQCMSRDELSAPNGHAANLPTTCLIPAEDAELDKEKSVKDRMFLSTDDASCLLFTQTVTSPMLTPSEENIDFLKGFRRESSDAAANNAGGSPKDELNNGNALEQKTSTSRQADRSPLKPDDREVEELARYCSASDVTANGARRDAPEAEDENGDATSNSGENLTSNVSDDVIEYYEALVETTDLASNVADDPSANDETAVERTDLTSNVADDPSANDETVAERTDLTSNVADDPSAKDETVADTTDLTSNVADDSSETIAERTDLASAKVAEGLIESHEADVTSKAVERPIENRETAAEVTGVTSNVEMENHERAVVKMTNGAVMREAYRPHETTHTESVRVLKGHFTKTAEEKSEPARTQPSDELDKLRSVNIMRQISKFEGCTANGLTNDTANLGVSMTTESHFVETTTEISSTGDVSLKKKKTKKSKNQHEKENISVNETRTNGQQSHYAVNVKNLCRSFGDLTKLDGAEHGPSLKNGRQSKSSFSKFDALQKKNVLNASSPEHDNAHDGTNCKKCGRPVFQMEKIIAERCVYHRNCFRCVDCSKQLMVDSFESHEGALYCKPHFRNLFVPKAVEDNVPASDKPDLGLEELHSLNMKERFQVFENAKQSSDAHLEKNTVKMERSPSILSKLARFQAKGMDVGVSDEALNGVPIESSEEEEPEVEEYDGEDADLVRAKRVQKEKPFHFSQMSDVKNKWEQGNAQSNRDERREERKQEIQNIRSRLFMGKQGKMKEAYQQAISESQSATKLPKEVPTDVIDSRSIKDKFEKGELISSEIRHKETEDMSVFESGISKKSRSIFQELDSTGTRPPKMAPASPPKSGASVRSARESPTLEPEVYSDPDVVRAEDYVEDQHVAKATHTATKMLNKFRQMEENLQRGQENQGPKPLKRFTPPREPARRETSSEEETEEESEEEVDHSRMPERDLLEAQKAARARQLKAKFERWEETAEERQQNQVNVIESYTEDDSQTETTKTLRAKFESLREGGAGGRQSRQAVKVNRFVSPPSAAVICESCKDRVYPLELISVHGHVYHKNCFRCRECNAVLRMDSYSYNQGLLYCKTHFKRLFISKGNYDTAFGLEQRKEKWNVTTVA